MKIIISALYLLFFFKRIVESQRLPTTIVNYSKGFQTNPCYLTDTDTFTRPEDYLSNYINVQTVKQLTVTGWFFFFKESTNPG